MNFHMFILWCIVVLIVTLFVLFAVWFSNQKRKMLQEGPDLRQIPLQVRLRQMQQALSMYDTVLPDPPSAVDKHDDYLDWLYEQEFNLINELDDEAEPIPVYVVLTSGNINERKNKILLSTQNPEG